MRKTLGGERSVCGRALWRVYCLGGGAGCCPTNTSQVCERAGARTGRSSGSSTEVLTEGVIEGLRSHLSRPGALPAGPRHGLGLLLASVTGAGASPTSGARSASSLLVEMRRLHLPRGSQRSPWPARGRGSAGLRDSATGVSQRSATARHITRHMPAGRALSTVNTRTHQIHSPWHSGGGEAGFGLREGEPCPEVASHAWGRSSRSQWDPGGATLTPRPLHHSLLHHHRPPSVPGPSRSANVCQTFLYLSHGTHSESCG